MCINYHVWSYSLANPRTMLLSAINARLMIIRLKYCLISQTVFVLWNCLSQPSTYSKYAILGRTRQISLKFYLWCTRVVSVKFLHFSYPVGFQTYHNVSTCIRGPLHGFWFVTPLWLHIGLKHIWCIVKYACSWWPIANQLSSVFRH